MALSAAGCDTLGNKIMDTVKGEVTVACPKANIIADAVRRLQYREGSGRDLTDIDNEITIKQVTVGCKSKIDRDTRSGKVSASINLDLTISRGPANKDRFVDFGYFVAVTDLADKVLYREGLNEKVVFAENQTRLEYESGAIILDIPIQAGQTGDNYRILVGMQLTRDQLKLNRIDRRPGL
ncbi:MAG: hypothetical protein VW268_14750 [Rhodospirillaceae bacterium]